MYTDFNRFSLLEQAVYDALMFDLLMLMAHKQSYVTVGYCLINAVIQARLQCSTVDMSTFILHNTFKTTTPIVET